MSEQKLRRLLNYGVAELKGGEFKAAKRYLQRALVYGGNSSTMADVWFYLSETESDESEKREALEEALAYNSTHSRARRALAILKGTLNADEIINADNIIAPPASERKTNADRFECPNCGGVMSFSPDGQTLVCDYCAAGSTQENEESKEHDFFSTMATLRGHSKPNAHKVFHCKGCGAEFLLAPNDISETCAYCASPHVVNHGETRDLLDPDAIIPHQFSQRRATKTLVAWVSKNNFTPQGTVLPPRGFYVPVWTFDVGGSISYSGERQTENPQQDGFGFSTKTAVVTEHGESSVFVDDLIIPAAKKYERFLHSLIKNYNLAETKKYKARYLSNWSAETYEIELSTAALEARSRAYEAEKKKLKRSLCNLSNLRTSSANMAITSYKLLLLPVWITTYPYENEDYLVLINGQNAEVLGELPKAFKPEKKKSGFMGWLDDVF